MPKYLLNKGALEARSRQAVELLQALVAIPSVSRQEAAVADYLQTWLQQRNYQVNRTGNNLWMRQACWQPDKPVLLLNSHLDTVQPVSGFSRSPYAATRQGERLYGLGSNDAGGSLVSLLITFLAWNTRPLPYNLLFLASAEEEISGPGGVRAVLPELGPVACGVVGEPTQMRLAVAEKGLLVIDAYARGQSGHAARNEGENAIYHALADIQHLRQLTFPRQSQWLGPVKLSVTGISAGTQHNVVPDTCHYYMDIRPNEQYTNNEIWKFLQTQVASELKPRSLRLNPSRIAESHPLVQAGIALKLERFGSPTLSDQALMPFPTVKLGPGHSARSHTADEYITIPEIREGIQGYDQLLEALK